MNRLEDFSNEKIADIILFETEESIREILNKEFPNSKVHHVHVFSNGDAEIKIDDRHIKVFNKEIN